MTEQEKELLTERVEKWFEEAILNCDDFELIGIEAEKKLKLKKIEDGVDPFPKPPGQEIECIGCGS
jgi:hypothetical protein